MESSNKSGNKQNNNNNPDNIKLQMCKKKIITIIITEKSIVEKLLRVSTKVVLKKKYELNKM